METPPESAEPAAEQAPKSPSVTPEKLHEHALQAEKHLEQLATGLANAGADPAATKVVSQMADATRKIIKSLASAAQATQPEPPPGVDGATDDMQAELKAKRAEGQA